jgi:hypothetical protein
MQGIDSTALNLKGNKGDRREANNYSQSSVTAMEASSELEVPEGCLDRTEWGGGECIWRWWHLGCVFVKRTLPKE